MFTELYLHTTNPKITLFDMFRENLGSILVSVVFHTVIYSLTLNVASFIFFGKFLSSAVNVRLSVVLLFIMFFGYIARYYHVKDIYGAYRGDIEKVRAHCDRLYIGWIFIG
jgi:hypothetical protein